MISTKDVDLNKWQWLRQITGLDIEAVSHYKELASKNEVLMVSIYNQDAFNIYIPKKGTR